MKIFMFLLFLVVFSCQSPIKDSNCDAPYFSDYENGFQQVYKNGKIIGVGHLDNGYPKGFWKRYNDNGTLISEGHFKYKQKEGFWKTYYPSGEVKTEGHYKSCVKSGYWKYYKKDATFSEEWN